ncbi:MAG: hypothetical protein AB1553_00575 [Nitrospirota bacterium]
MARVLTKFGFRRLFTIEERAGITAAAASDVVLKTIMDDLAFSDEVDLDDPATIEGVNYLVAGGLITAERAAAILATPAPAALEPVINYTVTVKAQADITLQNKWGAVERPWGYEVRADFRNEATGEVINEVITFPAVPTDAEVNTKITEIINRLRTNG